MELPKIEQPEKKTHREQRLALIAAKLNAIGNSIISVKTHDPIQTIATIAASIEPENGNLDEASALAADIYESILDTLLGDVEVEEEA